MIPTERNDITAIADPTTIHPTALRAAEIFRELCPEAVVTIKRYAADGIRVVGGISLGGPGYLIDYAIGERGGSYGLSDHGIAAPMDMGSGPQYCDGHLRQMATDRIGNARRTRAVLNNLRAAGIAAEDVSELEVSESGPKGWKVIRREYRYRVGETWDDVVGPAMLAGAA